MGRVTQRLAVLDEKLATDRGWWGGTGGGWRRLTCGAFLPLCLQRVFGPHACPEGSMP